MARGVQSRSGIAEEKGHREVGHLPQPVWDGRGQSEAGLARARGCRRLAGRPHPLNWAGLLAAVGIIMTGRSGHYGIMITGILYTEIVGFTGFQGSVLPE